MLSEANSSGSETSEFFFRAAGSAAIQRNAQHPHTAW
jgi:hypothetical protein